MWALNITMRLIEQVPIVSTVRSTPNNKLSNYINHYLFHTGFYQRPFLLYQHQTGYLACLLLSALPRYSQHSRLQHNAIESCTKSSLYVGLHVISVTRRPIRPTAYSVTSRIKSTALQYGIYWRRNLHFLIKISKVSLYN